VRVSVILIVAMILVSKVMPHVLAWGGHFLSFVSTRLFRALAYPEYVLTRAARSLGRRPIFGTFAYGALLGVGEDFTSRLGGWLVNRFDRRVRFPWKSAVASVTFIMIVSFGGEHIPSGAVQQSTMHLQGDVQKVDRFLATGRWSADAPKKTVAKKPAKKQTPSKVPTKKTREKGATKKSQAGKAVP
jgi:hypothetical protein